MTSNSSFRIWEGVYRTFAEASADSTVFEGEIWLEKITRRAEASIKDSAGDFAIPPVAVTTDSALPFVAALAACPGKPIRILDFGGGLGASFLPLARMLPKTQAIEFVVIENETVCKKGRRIFDSDRRIEFLSEIPGNGVHFDIVHFGSALHYVEDWLGVLSRLTPLTLRYLVLADLLAADNQTFVTAQFYHGQRIPVRFWNLPEFIDQVTDLGYELLLKARYRGATFAQEGGLPTGHFEEEFRLDYATQLIFRRDGDGS